MTPISEEHFTHFHYGEVFVGHDVHLDGGWFEDCSFHRCHIVFEGRRPFGFVRCTSTESPLVVDGPARRILQLLVTQFTPATLDGLIADIRAG